MGLHGEIKRKIADAGKQHGFDSKKEFGTMPGKQAIGLGRVDVAWLQNVKGVSLPVALFEIIVSEQQSQLRGAVMNLLSFPSYLRVLVIPFKAILKDWAVPEQPQTKSDRMSKQWLEKQFPNYAERVVSRFPEIKLWRDAELAKMNDEPWIGQVFSELLK